MSGIGRVFGGGVVAALCCASSGALAHGDEDALGLRGALGRSSAVVEARVTDVTMTFSERGGPRTLTTLSDVVVHAGELGDGDLVLSTFGGELPDGRFVDVAELPVLTSGTRYLLLLRSGEWFLSPLVAGMVFRLEASDRLGDDVLLDETGALVLAANEVGVGVEPIDLTPGHRDLSRPFDPLPLVEGAQLAMVRGRTKADLLSTIEDLSAHLAGGELQHEPIDRPWNVWETAHDDQAEELGEARGSDQAQALLSEEVLSCE